MANPKFHAYYLHPRYWPTWIGCGGCFLLAQLPYRLQRFLGKWLGRALYRVAKRRRQIAEGNIALCFPHLSADEQKDLVYRTMESIGIAFFETCMAWFWPRWRLDRCYTLAGLEHLLQAEVDGTGVVLMALHFTHIDIGAKILSRNFSIDATYRPDNNPVFDFVQRRGRERHSMRGRAISRDDVRAVVKALRAGRTMWYAPDQDYGPKSSVFVPFFGVQAATVTATSQLARLGKARVIPFTQTRKSDGSGYHLQVYPPLEGFPSGDDVADARRVNRVAEELIVQQPEQYLWVHRRFKTRPEGEPDLYEQLGVKPKRHA